MAPRPTRPARHHRRAPDPPRHLRRRVQPPPPAPLTAPPGHPRHHSTTPCPKPLPEPQPRRRHPRPGPPRPRRQTGTVTLRVARPTPPHRHRTNPRPNPRHPARPGPPRPRRQRRHRRTPPRAHHRPHPRLPTHRTPRPNPEIQTRTPMRVRICSDVLRHHTWRLSSVLVQDIGTGVSRHRKRSRSSARDARRCRKPAWSSPPSSSRAAPRPRSPAPTGCRRLGQQLMARYRAEGEAAFEPRPGGRTTSPDARPRPRPSS